MNRKIASYYRLTKQEKDALVEQCRKRIEEERIKDTETVRKILEELLEAKWDKKKKTAQEGMQAIVDDLERQVMEAQASANRNSASGSELRQKLAASEKRESELQTKLNLTEARLSELRSDHAKQIGELKKKLMDSENTVSTLRTAQTKAEDANLRKTQQEAVKEAELKNQLTFSQETVDTLRKLQTTNETTIANLRKKLSESARENEDLRGELKNKIDISSSLQKDKEIQTLEKKIKQMTEEHKENISSARGLGLLLGWVIAAALCVITFPTQYVTDVPFPPEQNLGLSGTYSGGLNMFGNYAGFGELHSSNETVCNGFWTAGNIVFATEYIFPNETVYVGVMREDHRPWGPGTYTRVDGESVFGFWSWAQEKEVTIRENDKEYIYTGPTRFGKPYGYGIFKEVGEERRFIGEYYEDYFRNGTWIESDGTIKKVTST